MGTSYERKVIYFSEYQNKTMKENAGFARIEVLGGQIKVHISIKADSRQINWKCYAYQRNGRVAEMVFLGDLKREGSNWVLTTGAKADNMKGSGIPYEKIKGIIVLDGEDHYCAEIPLGDVTFSYERKQKNPPEVMPVKAAATSPVPETPKEMAVPEKPSEEKKAEEKQDASGDWALRLLQELPEMYPFEDDELEKCVRLEPKDFGFLPAGEWQVAKNTFLLEGYYEYRHIIFATKEHKDKKKYYLGVPGTYHRRECFLANMFGFSYFKGIRKKENTLGDFGYWFKELS